ncbi:MAG: branched-chain amino acid ABC transporter permease [Deltaproteobacteria bacterium]|nr:branched-chain amino acid ABC transporter permease [Deltaproteobacteria bacterium]
MDTVLTIFRELGPTIYSSLELIGVYVILALSLNMINGMAGMFSIGHAGFWAVGAYSAAAVTVHGPVALGGPLLLVISIVVAMVAAGVAGFILAVPCLRLTGDYLAIVTLGFSIIIVTLLYNFEYMGAATGVSTPILASKGVIWFMVLLTLIVYYRLQFSSLGRTIQALREDEIAAQSVGLNRVRLKTIVFVIGAAMAGLAGALYASSQTYLSPAGFEFDKSIKLLTMVVLGGLGSITGVAVAAVLLTLLPEVLRLFSLDAYQMLVFSGMLLVMVLLRPQGLMGRYEIWDLPLLRRYWRPGGAESKS